VASLTAHDLTQSNGSLSRSTHLYLFGNGISPRKSQRKRKAIRKRKANRQAKNARTMGGPLLKKLLIRIPDDHEIAVHAWWRSRMKMRRLYNRFHFILV